MYIFYRSFFYNCHILIVLSADTETIVLSSQNLVRVTSCEWALVILVLSDPLNSFKSFHIITAQSIEPVTKWLESGEKSISNTPALWNLHPLLFFNS